MTSARDILNLGLVSSSVWKVVRTELYRVEVIQTREEENADVDASNVSAPEATPLQQQQALDARLHHSRMPAIHFSIREGHNSTTDALIQAAKNHWPEYLDAVWGSGMTPLHLAAATGNTEVVKALHMGGCVLNAEVYLPTGRAQILDGAPNLPELSRLYRYQLLHSPYWREQVDSLSLAIIHKRPATTEYLLEHMDLQRPSLPNDEPISPLFVAALVGDDKMVEILLSLNYPLEGSRLVDNVARQETALHYAAAHFLLDYSIQTNDLQVSDWDFTFDWALSHSHMRPPLQALVDNTEVSSEESMQSVLRHLISTYHYDEDIKPRSMFLINNLFPVGSKHRGYTIPWDECNINAPYYPMEDPETVLQQAISTPAYTQKLLQDLLECRDWDLEATDVKGRTAFDYAIFHRVYDAALMLMERNAEWKFRTSAEKEAMARWLRKQPNTGGKPFHWAARLEQSVKDFRLKLREEAAARRRTHRMTSSTRNAWSW
ncbi:hypothetical protein PG985_000949 [Apiospora marii]|uniref:Uncharacterized protein n=1 Tax=Apiospora marii TaxID=335849 RepID=A0ABR1RGI6_9PEZI